MNEDIYKKLSKKYSPEELVEGYVFPVELSEEEESKLREEILLVRQEKLRQNSDQERMFAELVRLKLQITDYIKAPYFDPNLHFGSFLTEYLNVIRRSQKEFASDIAIHPSRLNRLLHDKEDPNIELTYRLEKHSGGTIPAILWWKLLIKKQEYLLKIDSSTRKKEEKKVKNDLRLSA
ncbi:MAG: hypothetical protein KDD63_25445 [Bacteroidetes bacterium]|nr:hypothetical protein [Bacteroidota bacterium]MCB0841775.1 hypothetical protein [Bacteroidota bacterium]MCB0855603.1 hypothetical protein [Bacteroidota bacterium]